MNAARNEKQRKKLAELEAQLVLASPNLPFRISKRTGSVHTFLIASEYERDQWGEAIHILQVRLKHFNYCSTCHFVAVPLYRVTIVVA